MMSTDLSIGNAEEDSRCKIHNVYIAVDGVVVFHRVYGSIEKDPVLVSSFLGAIASLSREVTDYGILKSIEIPPMKIGATQIMDSPQVLVAIASSMDFPEFAMSRILGNIGELFLQKYADKITVVGVRDLSDSLKDDVHKAIMTGIKEATLPYDPSNRNHRIQSLLKNITSPSYSCPFYDANLRGKCKLDPRTFRVADCEGVAFSKGLPCALATHESIVEEARKMRRKAGDRAS
ncbi:MAG: hypothetical protein WED05_11435 [Candidatus Atabeyarchaeum deiterrae]